MAVVYPRLYIQDLALGLYSGVSSSTDSDDISSKCVVDGDPNSLWLPSSDPAIIIVTFESALCIRGFAISNHNIPIGAMISVHGLYSSSWHEFYEYTQTVTEDDFLIDFGTDQTAAEQVRVVILGAGAGLMIGEISILGDYGYNAAGQLVHGQGFGIIELGGANVGGVNRQLSVRGDTGVASVVATNGFTQYQRLGSVTERFVLPLSLLRASRDLEMWQLWNAYCPRRRGTFANPGFTKGIWFTSNDYDVSTPSARYCVGCPDDPLEYTITHLGPRAEGHLTLQTLPREPVA